MVFYLHEKKKKKKKKNLTHRFREENLPILDDLTSLNLINIG